MQILLDTSLLYALNDADAELDFADAAVIALAERLDIEHVATFDRRDFSIIRPQHCQAFQLLP